MSAARVGFATSHPFIIHRSRTCSGLGQFEIWFITVTHIFMQPVLIFFSHISIIHARLPRSRRWHLSGLSLDQGPKSPLAKYEKTLVSQYQFRRKNQMSLNCRLPFSTSLPPTHTDKHTHVSAKHLYPMFSGWQFQCHFQIYAMTANGKCPQCPRHNKGRICDK